MPELPTKETSTMARWSVGGIFLEAEAFRSWFGDAADFELIDATVGEIGGRLHLSWRIRLRPAPFGIGEGWHVIEQHGYADAADTMETLDLLCSGFHAEGAHTPV